MDFHLTSVLVEDHVDLSQSEVHIRLTAHVGNLRILFHQQVADLLIGTADEVLKLELIHDAYTGLRLTHQRVQSLM
ncbi:hypothetical protein D3C86_1812720 [compost metagenome]